MAPRLAIDRKFEMKVGIVSICVTVNRFMEPRKRFEDIVRKPENCQGCRFGALYWTLSVPPLCNLVSPAGSVLRTKQVKPDRSNEGRNSSKLNLTRFEDPSGRTMQKTHLNQWFCSAQCVLKYMYIKLLNEGLKGCNQLWYNVFETSFTQKHMQEICSACVRIPNLLKKIASSGWWNANTGAVLACYFLMTRWISEFVVLTL